MSKSIAPLLNTITEPNVRYVTAGAEGETLYFSNHLLCHNKQTSGYTFFVPKSC